jgi:transposase
MAYFREVVGIDVSKENLDLYVLSSQQGRTLGNDDDGHAELIGWLRSLGVRMAVMEASGGYERAAAGALRRAGSPGSLRDPTSPLRGEVKERAIRGRIG